MERKGLSQILYLIIAASVLMMVAMVVTFTASDILGTLGGQAEEGACSDALGAKCGGTGSTAVTVPTTCVTESQYNAAFLRNNPPQDGPPNQANTNPVSAQDLAGGTTAYIECSVVP